MQYRQFGKLNIAVSALGFGLMRLPVIDNDNSKIDEAEAIKMIRYAIDNGVNYIDTAWPYHGGNSEIVAGKALKDGYREKTFLATKLPTWLINEKEDMDKYLNEQLKKLQTDHIDFYLLHALDKNKWENMKKVDALSWAEKKKQEGKIRYIGFSFHDEYPVFQEIVDYYDKWDFCQIQYNYMDIDVQAGEKGLKYAASKGLGVVIMEPIRGGRLANPPKAVQDIWDTAKVKRTPAEWALQWLWNQPEVSVVLSGMSTFEQLKENIESAKRSGINTLTKEELEIVSKVRNKYKELSPIACTGCNYCMPCPNGVNIPRNFELYNEAHMYNTYEANRRDYENLGDAKASSCIECGTCESVCPQHLTIIDYLKEVANYFERA
ncbi:putative oxidoreductases of the aldo/keto reductase family [Thermoanaerobacter thermohydrosulfuricus WC1]|uniref:Putative oxidoreductases of the aldo/keto reductase family n=1 Tax=Thermoanaerobacter thermohydrosulfuricus WC1 TaxID=1198630 RepID=M8DTP7_THETY|nr:aldo/keto reductase [Thermoanaerobacter thermohydrosulfuricus]EMT39811.1 putative oxidoreductases of the aldo/keto reductase family [Thermoanaerobacter thermohydrosulfuricus WC1]